MAWMRQTPKRRRKSAEEGFSRAQSQNRQFIRGLDKLKESNPIVCAKLRFAAQRAQEAEALYLKAVEEFGIEDPRCEAVRQRWMDREARFQKARTAFDKAAQSR